MNSISAIDNLYTFDDGDTLTPGMGIVWVNGETNVGLEQYYNPSRVRWWAPTSRNILL